MKHQALSFLKDKIKKTAIAVMHAPHTFSDFGHCRVIHCDIGGVSLVDQ